MPRILLIGNSDGIGLATTRLLLDQGWAVCGISRSASPVAHGAYSHRVCDVQSPDFVAAVAGVLETGDLDACVYCAGIGEFYGEGPLEKDLSVFNVNLNGAVAASAMLLPAFARAGAGHFVVLSSLADSIVSPQAPSYAASKAGLTAYYLGLAEAVKSKGVHISVISFGFVKTKMAKGESLPLAISAEEAAAVVLKTLKNRRRYVRYPRIPALLMGLLGWLQRRIA